tara:strand:+ start:4990 stop:5424 length:435 start_codon:yes stop_codon:yes gene_type:complete
MTEHIKKIISLHEPVHKILVILKIGAVIFTAFWIILLIIIKVLEHFTHIKYKKLHKAYDIIGVIIMWLIALCILSICLMSMHKNYNLASPIYIYNQASTSIRLRDLHKTDNMSAGIDFWMYGFILILTIMSLIPALRKDMYMLF